MTLSASRTGHPSIKDVGVAPSTSAGSPPITQINFLTCRAHYPGGPNRCVSVSSLSARPSPVNRRVGIHDFTFEACSSFTRVTACKVARPPKDGLVSRGFDLASCPTKSLGSYHVLPTATWMDPPSIGDLRHWGALLTIGLPEGSCSVPRRFPLVTSKALILPSLKFPTSKALAKVPKLGGAIAIPQGEFSGPFEIKCLTKFPLVSNTAT